MVAKKVEGALDSMLRRMSLFLALSGRATLPRSRPLSGVKRTPRNEAAMAVNDPEQTLGTHRSMNPRRIAANIAKLADLLHRAVKG
jgi:hypothetical protein